MAYVKINLKDAKEPEVVEEGEYDLRVVRVNDKESQAGEAMTLLTIAVENASIPNPMPINQNLMYPNGGQYDNMRALEIRRFCELFEVPYDERGFDPSDFLGKTARALVMQEEGKDKVIRNKIRAPRVKE